MLLAIPQSCDGSSTCSSPVLRHDQRVTTQAEKSAYCPVGFS
jgi:hypothetical protein